MKKLLLIFICLCSLKADIKTTVENIIGTKSYETNKNLIDYIFRDRNAFYTKYYIDYEKVSQTLKDNNLLKLKLPKTSYVNMTFKFSNPSFLGFLDLKEILKKHGYYYFTRKIEKQDSMIWEIRFKTEKLVSPLILAKELAQGSCRIVDIKRQTNTRWYYEIDNSKAFIGKAEDLVSNNELLLRKNSKPYLIRVNGVGAISITSNSGNRWHPNVVFYDENMHILKIYKKDIKTNNLVLSIPENTNYIKINDLYSLYNLKRGIYISKE